jgi:hypothetical protein
VAGIRASVVTGVDVILYAGACLNALATSPVVLKVLAELCASWATSLGHSIDSSNNSPLLTPSVLSMACAACSLSQVALLFISRMALEHSSSGLTTAPSLNRVTSGPGL